MEEGVRHDGPGEGGGAGRPSVSGSTGSGGAPGASEAGRRGSRSPRQSLLGEAARASSVSGAGDRAGGARHTFSVENPVAEEEAGGPAVLTRGGERPNPLFVNLSFKPLPHADSAAIERRSMWFDAAEGAPSRFRRWTRLLARACGVMLKVWPIVLVAGIVVCQSWLGEPQPRSWLGDPTAASRVSYLFAIVHTSEEGRRHMWGMSFLPLYVPQSFSFWLALFHLHRALSAHDAPGDWFNEWWTVDKPRPRAIAVGCYVGFILGPSVILVAVAWIQLFEGMGKCKGCLFSFMCVFTAAQVTFLGAAASVAGWYCLASVKVMRIRFKTIRRAIRGSVMVTSPVDWAALDANLLDRVQGEWLQMHSIMYRFVEVITPFFSWLLLTFLLFLTVTVLTLIADDCEYMRPRPEGRRTDWEKDVERLKNDLSPSGFGLMWGFSYILAIGGFLLFSMVYANDGYLRIRENIMNDIKTYQLTRTKFSLESAAAHNFFQLADERPIQLKAFGVPITPTIFKTYMTSSVLTVIGSLMPALIASGVFGSTQ